MTPNRAFIPPKRRLRMPRYRCYVLDKQDRIESGTDITAEDDASALTSAAASVRTSELYPTLEIWQGSRIVGRVPQRDGKD